METPFKIIQTDSGEYVRFNPEIGGYEFVQTEELTSHIASSGSEFVETNVLTSPSQSSTTDILNKNKWGNQQTLLFIEICNKYKEQLNSPKYKKTEVYKLIATELSAKFYFVTHEQCTNKMKTLLHKYREIKDHNNTTGNDPKYWEFYEAVENYLGENRPNVIPKAACSNLSLKHVENTLDLRINLPGTSKSNFNKDNCGGESSIFTSSRDEPPRKKNKIGQRVSPSKEMAKWLNEYKKEQAQRHQQLLEQSATQHNESKQLISDLINLLKDQNEK